MVMMSWAMKRHITCIVAYRCQANTCNITRIAADRCPKQRANMQERRSPAVTKQHIAADRCHRNA